MLENLKFKEYIKRQRKAAFNLPNAFVSMVGNTGIRRDNEIENMLKATENRKLCRSLIAHLLNGHTHKKILLFAMRAHPHARTFTHTRTDFF